MPTQPYTKPEDFLPSLATLVLPSGKIIYVAEAGIYKVKLQQIQNVTWTYYDPQTNQVKGTQVFPSGFLTDPVDNSFVAGGVAYVEVDGPGVTARAELNHENFDAAILENLPSADQLYAQAKTQSDKANRGIDNEDRSWVNDLLSAAKWGLIGYVGVNLIRR